MRFSIQTSHWIRRPSQTTDLISLLLRVFLAIFTSHQLSYGCLHYAEEVARGNRIEPDAQILSYSKFIECDDLPRRWCTPILGS